MADGWGIDDGYEDVHGAWHSTPEETRRALRLAMGGLAEVNDPPQAGRPVWFVRQGTAPSLQRPAELVLEDATALAVGDALPPDLPLGYHDLHPSDGGITTRLIVVPDRVAPPPERAAALAVQLYAARSSTSWGIGDLGDLATIADWAGGRGVRALLVSPLHAPLPTPDPEASPYYASSRCWQNPLHLRIDGDAAQSAAGLALNADPRIDRAAVWALKRAALRAEWEAGGDRSDFERWRAVEGDDLERYATFCALAEHHRRGWTTWPSEHRHPAGPAVARFAAAHADDVSFHAWVQWRCERQHRSVAEGTPVGLIHDLAVGADPDGADSWLWQDVVALRVRVGAPPDEFNGDGQDWGLPPFIPWRLRSAGYAPLAQLFRSAFRNAAGLRVDHVMGLFRLWWVPPGFGAAEGGYVRFPGSELLDVLKLESVRAGAYVVGEDLGTVEHAVRDALADAGVLSYRLAWFEDSPPSSWPRQAMAAITTHDLPTIAGVWSGVDDPERAMSPRLLALAGSTDSAAEAAVAAHRALASAPSHLVSATLEDAVGVVDRPNRPGTVGPDNWTAALPVEVDDLGSNGQANAVLDALTAPD